ncbi:outer membrane beta-barrel protein [Alloacidobacterium dinghuense]|uniref:Outer membrane beta-barrel protein n=1 Tax=Alloacidobacterium dinghuense TaxID=2763107 RepID=A0A7G8BJ92_9BACT|nr:outer membrane beta-barrel protein [Alloacidobacterium dinghuense]QNI32612.1 outer membrane beta-barrel protein [Alloacidobacterium dinghuense]
MFQKLFAFALLLLPLSTSAQVAPAVSGHGWSLSAGAEYSNFQPDWGPDRLQGIAVFADVDHILLRNLGAEGEARWLRFSPPQGETEDNYLLGPRYRVWRHHALSLYGKFLLGGGWITYYPSTIGSGSYFAYAPGGTAEFRVARRWSVRGDYEYQFWPSAPGLAFTFPNPSHGLSPNGFSVGASYKIF